MSALAALFYGMAAACVWGAFLDTTPPIDILTGHVVSYDRDSRLMIVEWEALKHRYCPGMREGWLRDGVTVPLPATMLPPEDFRGAAAPDESVVRWRVAVEVPDYLRDDFVYKAEWDFSCNFVQTVFPLRVQSPFITVRQG
jgi:hypothetical protein